MGFFPAVVSHTLYPIFAGLAARGEFGELRVVLQRYLRFLLALALPLGVGGSILAPKLIALLAGPEFAASAPVLAILVWAPAVLFVYIVANSLVISQLTKWAVLITGVNVLVNTLGNLLLLPHYGIKAAAIMTVVSELLQAGFYFYFVRVKITKFSFFGFLWRPALASAVMGFVLWPLAQRSIAISIPLAALAYFVSLGVFGFFKSDDLQFLRAFFKKGSPEAVIG
jgi:O-antigen/teichoic acid export membrane protein